MAPVVELDVPRLPRDTELKWNGWGYSDTYFALSKNKDAFMTGARYEISGQAIPQLRTWFEQHLEVDVSRPTPSIAFSELDVPPPTLNAAFLDFLQAQRISFSNKDAYRVNRSHGHTVHDMFALRHNHLERVPDLVVWPKDEQEVLKVVQAANKFDVVLIPIGGGTSVTNAVNCPPSEGRCICSLDMQVMAEVLWLDEANLVARVQPGLTGVALERRLNAAGYTCGHEPDSMEFSTVGGWLSTRASGMKKNRYGNIEDLVLHVNFVTAKGILRKQAQLPRLSAGPDLHHVVLGSEGIFGVVTEVSLKMFPLPEVRQYGSIVFPNFEKGVAFFREVARQEGGFPRIQPASLRLVDNEQFIMGQSMKTANTSWWHALTSAFGRAYITKWKGFKIDELVAATCVFEGSELEVAQQAKRLYDLAAELGGVAGGEENGRYGYRLTFAIAYLRDLGMEYGMLGESFETSVPWDKVLSLCRNVKEVLKREAKSRGVQHPVLSTCRVTQVYDSGACVYFYFAFNCRGLEDPLQVYDAVEVAAREEVIACGGSISHHHGVGKLRKRWLTDTISPGGVGLLKALKRELDPNNVFAANNLFDHSVQLKSRI